MATKKELERRIETLEGAVVTLMQPTEAEVEMHFKGSVEDFVLAVEEVLAQA